MAEFDGKVILITGGGTGLGAAIAVGTARRGAKVLLLNYSKSRKEAEATAKEVQAAGAEAVLVQGDVSEDADCHKIAAAAAPYGKLDVLVNNAGTTKHAPKHADLDALSKEDFLRIYATNTVAPFQMIRACRILLEAAGTASVLMTSSIAAVTGGGSSVAYAASKGALNTMTLSLARALAPKIRVNAICPGFIDTRWFRDAYDKETAEKQRENVRKSTPLQVVSTAEDIADAALFLISDASRRITGETLLVDAGTHLGFAPLRAR
jgi:NAD(P)-dependent dehydrogenase (short-subunit alcohol dehydrogenase family)